LSYIFLINSIYSATDGKVTARRRGGGQLACAGYGLLYRIGLHTLRRRRQPRT